MIVILKKTS